MTTDADLLARYANEQAQDAFAEFVGRNIGLVYAAALRRLGGHPELAEEVAQKVFTDASRKAGALARHPAVTGWLYQTTRYAATDALRSEIRRSRLAATLASMHDDASSQEPDPDWEKLRPVLDEVMDELGDRERELILLRYFQGLSHAQVGEQLGLSENAARKRADRALDSLRTKLTKRGIPSTAAALGVMLSGLPLCAAPKGIAATVTSIALATPPASGLTGLLLLATMSKVTTPIIVAAVTAGLTTLAWSASHQDLAPEIAKQQAEYRQLKEATAQGASAQTVASVAADYERNASAIADALGKHNQAGSQSAAQAGTGTAQPSASLSPHGYANQGRSSAVDAVFTFAWACDVCDPQVLGEMVYLDAETRAHALKVLATMPETVRAKYPTAEAFYGFLLAAACVEAPPPSAELARHLMNVVELGEGRIATRRTGSTANHHEFQQTTDGWKYVLPDVAIESLPQLLNSPVLNKLGDTSR
jgi:RNA polymerase sigma factor (sigma-70 family)